MISIILDRPKYPHNLAAAIRAAACFDACQVLYSGHRFEFAEGERLPREERMKGYSHVKVQETERPFDVVKGAVKICVELMPTSAPLTTFSHPLVDNTAYVFGPEDGHVRQSYRGLCHQFVFIPARHCLNLAAAINVVLAHRMMQRQQASFEIIGGPSDVLLEDRGEIAVAGWDGK